MSQFMIIAIEASGLGPESFPIQVACCSSDGQMTYDTLINPESAGDWDHWDSYAEEAIHGISWDDCRENGENVVSVAQKLEKMMENHLLYSDSPEYDQYWIERLFESVGKVLPAVIKPINESVPPAHREQLETKLQHLYRPHCALQECLHVRKVVSAFCDAA